MRWRGAVAGLALAAALGPLPGRAQPLVPLVQGWERTFRIDFSVGEERGQRVVEGWVENHGRISARRIRVLVDAVEGDRIVGQRLAWLGASDLVPATRVYFRVPVPAPASTYRVSVFDYDTRQFGQGPGGSRLLEIHTAVTTSAVPRAIVSP